MSGDRSEFVSDVGGSRGRGAAVYRVPVPGGYLYVTVFNQTVTSCFVPFIDTSRMGPK